MRTVRPYLLGAVLVAITTAAKLAVAPLGDFPYLMYFACVLAASLVGGWIPGVFTTALAALAANALFETPAGAFFESSRALLRGLGFVAECTAIVVLCDVVLVGREREREEAQRERRERVAIERERRRFTAIFEHALDAITLLDDEQRIVEANPAAAALFGRSREELVGRPARELMPPDEPPAIDTGSFRERGALRGETRLLRADGTVRRAEFCATADVLPGLHLSIIRDIEDRKRSDDALRFLEEASRILGSSIEYEETLAGVIRLAVPHIADWAAVDMLDDDGSVRRVAGAHADPKKLELAAGIWARQRAEETGIGEVIRSGSSILVEEATDEMLAEGIHDPVVLEMLRSLRIRSVMVVPLFVRGRVVGAVSFVSAESGRRYGPTDLAFAQELARRAGTAIEHAFAFRDSREANRVKDEFLAVVSHELRTPLNAILGWATLMRTHRAPDEDRALRTIERNARSLARLVDDVLDVSRIASGKLELDVKKLDLAAVLKECLEVTAPAARAKEIVVESSIEVDPCPLEGDAERLRQILWNLLSNAVKFTPNGGRIAVVLARRGGCVDVSVSDTGKGIPPELLPHVFERFRQGDSSAARAHGGLGLGLAIARQLAEFHGGTIRAESAGPGKGARFTLALPIRAATRDRRAPPEPAALSERAATGSAGEPSAPERRRPLDGVRVLVCEDDADSRELLASVLGSAGASLCVVASASETLDRLPRFHPDVLVSDIGLPDIDGYELAERMRHLPPEDGGQTPAIAVSAYARSDDARRALLAGYQEHLAKPVDPVQLVGKVRSLSGRSVA